MSTHEFSPLDMDYDEHDMVHESFIALLENDPKLDIQRSCKSCLEPRPLDEQGLCESCALLNRSSDGALLALIESTNGGAQPQEEK